MNVTEGQDEFPPGQERVFDDNRYFRYRPMVTEDGEDIRLVCLYPGRYRDSIRCDILHANFGSDIEYEALSYTWATEDGDAILSEQIDCAYIGDTQTQRLMVTVNCASALRRLRNAFEERILWVDAIAIDQSDREERNHQVGLMDRIYSTASQVVAYLGEEDLGFTSPGLWSDDSRRRMAMEKLFAKRWVSRVWVIQEVALAQRVMMVTGEVSCHLDAGLLSRIRARARAYRLQVPGPLAWDPMVNATRDLLTLLDMSRNCHSTDPRDKVYGLLGLTGERLQDLIKVDYSESVEEVLTRTATAIIICQEELHILAYASSDPTFLIAGARLPSWVPDWTQPNNTTPARHQLQHRAIGPWKSLDKHSGSQATYSTAMDWKKVVQVPSSWPTTTDLLPSLTVRAHCIGTIDSICQHNDGETMKWKTAQAFGSGLKALVSEDVSPLMWPHHYQWLLQSPSELVVSSPYEERRKLALPDTLSWAQRWS